MLPPMGFCLGMEIIYIFLLPLYDYSLVMIV